MKRACNFLLVMYFIAALAGCMAHQAAEIEKEYRERREAYVAAHPEIDDRTKSAVLTGTIFIGMRADAVEAGYGKPYKVNRTVNAGGNHEQWIYGFPNFDGRFITTKYLYITNGVLTAWQD